ncbi:DUF5684 domain-containing protein [Gemmata sp.]|uniref:DUF5684 domain-containing protein n=1 Tax=Gemmata sp. TaxID=1914242 RepID=UPI003F718CFF
MEILISLIGSLLVPLAFVVAILAGMWKVFEKAGQPGWAAIVPFYNVYILTIEIAKKEILWFILWFIPLVNIVAAVIVSIDVAKKFGKSELYGVGLAFLGFVFYPMLGFGDAQYEGNRSLKGGKRKSYDEDDEGGKNW